MREAMTLTPLAIGLDLEAAMGILERFAKSGPRANFALCIACAILAFAASIR